MLESSNGESTNKEVVNRFDNKNMVVEVVKKTSSTSGRFDMLTDIDLSVKLDEDNVDEDKKVEKGEHKKNPQIGQDHQMCGTKYDETRSPAPNFRRIRQQHENGYAFKCKVGGRGSEFRERAQLLTRGAEPSSVEDESPPSSPAGPTASVATHLRDEVTHLFTCQNFASQSSALPSDSASLRMK